MRGLMKMNAKLNPAIKIALVAVVLSAGTWLLLKRFQIEVGVVSTTPETVPIIETDPSRSETSPLGQASNRLATPDPARIAARQGSLRISNRSDQPLRVALLAKSSPNTRSSQTSTAKYEAPAHWDFAPGEGSSEGLIVSLPNQNTLLQRGDVVVAFAQDGSERYWGPFVVGETDLPRWNRQKGEWELVLEK